MIIVSQSLTIEYKDEDMREENIDHMVNEGYELVKKYNILDAYARNHLFAEFKNSRKGYVGLAI